MLVRQPGVIDDHFLVGIAQPFDNFARLEVPEDNLSTSRTTRDVSPIRTESNLTSVTGDRVACESLLLGLLERTIGIVDQYLVIEGLTGKVFFCDTMSAQCTSIIKPDREATYCLDASTPLASSACVARQCT